MKRYEHFTGCLKKVVRWRCVNFIPISFIKCRIHYLQVSTFEQSNSYEPPHEYIETLYLGMQCGIFTMFCMDMHFKSYVDHDFSLFSYCHF